MELTTAQTWRAPVEQNPIRIAEILLGLKDVELIQWVEHSVERWRSLSRVMLLWCSHEDYG